MPRFCLALLLVCAFAAPASAQPFETAGARALGMGGAFTAVADDVTAVWWNPAGLASGGFFGLALERNSLERDRSSFFLGIGTLPLGFSYIRTTDPRLNTQQAAVTVLQSLSETVVVGGTLKFVRGSVDGRSGNAFDADLAIMARAGDLKAGLTIRNAASPEFESADGQPVELPWRARAGVSYAATEVLTLALDLDLRAVAEMGEKRRNLAVGTEWRIGGSTRFALRSGARFDTVGDVNPIGTVGGSYAVRNGVWVDVWAAAGERAGSRGWGVAGRVVY